MTRFLGFRVVSGVILLAGCVAAILLCGKVIRRERAELRATAEANAKHIALLVESGVLAAVEPLDRLGLWWLTQGKPVDPEDWATDGKLFLARSPGLREAIWIGIDGIQKWSAAPGSVPNTAWTRPDQRLLPLIATCKASRKRVLSEPFAAPGTAPEIFACVPVIRGRLVRGYVLGRYEAPALVAAAAAGAAIEEQRVTIAAGGRRIYTGGPPSEGPEDDVVMPLQVGNQAWELELHAPLHYFREFRGLIASVIGVIGALLYSSIVLFGLWQRWSAELQRVNSTLESEVHRRAEAELEVRELNRELSRRVADFETLLDVTPIGIAVSDDPQCGRFRVNPALATMLGVPSGSTISAAGVEPEELPYRIQRDGRDLLPDEHPMALASSTGKSVAAEENQIVRADGTVLDVLSFASPVFDESGSVRGVLSAYVDISGLKRLERRLQRAERMKSLGAMAAGVAHNFNNVLTTIIGQGSLAVACVPKNSEAMEHIAASMEAAQQAAGLVQKVLTYTGHSVHTLRPMNLGETIKNIGSWLQTSTSAKPVIRLAIDPRLPEVMADAAEVRQALRNLVLNAVEAAGGAPAEIEIRADRCELSSKEPRMTFPDARIAPGSYVVVEVKDRGAGMPPEIAERAFDPFFSTKFLGRGLGLSEVLGMMMSHAGAVRLKTSPAAGTSVQLYFPTRELYQNIIGASRRLARSA